MGKSIANFGFDIPELDNCLLDTAVPIEISQESEYNVKECVDYYTEWEEKFNKKQKEIYQTIKNSVDKGERGFGYFVNGIGGAGIKSKIANALFGGRTFHSRFKVPININDLGAEVEWYNIPKDGGLAELIRESKLIVFDEITVECLNNTLQDLCSNDEFMGGKLIVLMGDFRQCLPIIKFGQPADVINACMNHSEIWHNFKQQTLKTNMRLVGKDKVCHDYAEDILKIGTVRYRIRASL